MQLLRIQKSRIYPFWDPKVPRYPRTDPQSYNYIYDSRSKVLYSNFNLGGPQPTHLYDFLISLCGVTQGNHAKHKLGARFAQGWRKCFHACVDYPYIYIYHIIVLYVYRFYHQSVSLNLLFVFLSAAVDTADAIH